jgi:hypothetical protein
MDAKPKDLKQIKTCAKPSKTLKEENFSHPL